MPPLGSISLLTESLNPIKDTESESNQSDCGYTSDNDPEVINLVSVLSCDIF